MPRSEELLDGNDVSGGNRIAAALKQVTLMPDTLGSCVDFGITLLIGWPVLKKVCP